jgi:hypothetical protein
MRVAMTATRCCLVAARLKRSGLHELPHKTFPVGNDRDSKCAFAGHSSRRTARRLGLFTLPGLYSVRAQGSGRACKHGKVQHIRQLIPAKKSEGSCAQDFVVKQFVFVFRPVTCIEEGVSNDAQHDPQPAERSYQVVPSERSSHGASCICLDRTPILHIE